MPENIEPTEAAANNAPNQPVANPPVSPQPVLTEQDEELILKRLQELGYLE